VFSKLKSHQPFSRTSGVKIKEDDLYIVGPKKGEWDGNGRTPLLIGFSQKSIFSPSLFTSNFTINMIVWEISWTNWFPPQRQRKDFVSPENEKRVFCFLLLFYINFFCLIFFYLLDIISIKNTSFFIESIWEICFFFVKDLNRKFLFTKTSSFSFYFFG
jgi:hypothetical protein